MRSIGTSCRSLLFLGVATLVLTISGCGSGNPYATTKIQGTVKYDDGSLVPASRIELRFVSQLAAIDEKTKPKMGLCEVNVEDGSFSTISTYEYGDGAIKGAHKVLAMAMDDRNVPTGAIPESYRQEATTSLSVDTSDSPLELVIPKP